VRRALGEFEADFAFIQFQVGGEGAAFLEMDLGEQSMRTSRRGRNLNSALSFLAERTRWAANLLQRLEMKSSIRGSGLR